MFPKKKTLAAAPPRREPVLMAPERRIAYDLWADGELRFTFIYLIIYSFVFLTASSGKTFRNMYIGIA